MGIAREGFPIIALSGLILAGLAVGLGALAWPLAIPPTMAWLAILAFFRDPPRKANFTATELCAPADGRVTEITPLEKYDGIDGPALRIGIFLSLFDVHINRSPAAGIVRSVTHRPGEFLDARRPESGERNESVTVVIDPSAGLPGPVVTRQVAGLVARRIVCHARVGDTLAAGERVGLIKFGSRTELIIPRRPTTEVLVEVGRQVYAGRTVMVRQGPSEQVR